MTTLDIALAGCLAFGQLTGNPREAITKHNGLQVIHADGAVTLRLAEVGRDEMATVGAKTVSVRMKDEHYPFEVVRHVKTWDDCGAVETWADIRHSETGAVRLVRADSFAAPVAVTSAAVRVMSLTGTAQNEANVSETSLANGQTLELVSSAGTRDAWEANASMMVSFGDGVDEEGGNVLGVALEWSGTSCRRIRRNWNGTVTEVFAGVDMTTGPYTLDPGVTFTTPRAILVLSEKGKGEVSRQYHRWAHRHLMPHGYDLHPVLLNSWEGSYFSFTEQTLLDMMDGVKEMGGEMFVLDDGWFGRGKYARDEVNKATAGLGDWCVNTNKLPRGLGWLADEAGRRGLKFGLWVEPEMANTNSWLYEAHPDWVLRESGRPLVCGRGKSQVVLDFANPAVRDNLFGQLDAVYAAIPSLAYVKWDCNANIWNPGSPYLAADRQPNLWYDYAMGYNELMARFQAKRPHVTVEACASGGGRMDFGSLRYADEFWPSDCTDPYQRIFIQWGCSQFYPASAMACDVTASPNHQTKRKTPLKYRFDVAMTGRLGFELHPKDMTADEIAFAKAAVADYKRIRPVVQRGDLYRLASPYEKPLAALMYVRDGERGTVDAVVFALGLKIEGERTETLHLRGLDLEATYSIKEINCGERLHLEEGSQSSATVSGRDLMERGLAVMLSGGYDSAVFEICRQEAVAGLAAWCCADGRPGYDTLIAHRGESVDAPENTLPAYKTAVERGFGFECDIYLSKDGRVFTFHDRNLTRTTDGANTNNCTDVTWDVVSMLDVGNWGKFKGSKFAGTRPALLDEVLELARDGRWLYIDVKAKDAKIVPYVKEIFARQTRATPANTLFLCGSVECGKEFKRLMPEFKVLSCLNCRNGWKKDSKPVAVSEIISTTREMGADGVDIRYDREVTTAEYIRTIKDEGFELHVWTVDDLADTLEAFRRGAQTVTTNCAKKQLDEYRKAAK